MKLVSNIVALACGGVIGLCCEIAPAQEVVPLTYPTTRVSDHVDEYHGTQTPDPYRWLEDIDSPETTAWVEAQNKVTFDWLDRVPQRGPLRRRLEQLWDHDRYGLPVPRGGRYFYTLNDGLQNQSVLYVATELAAEPRVLLDPNKLSADGTVHLTEWQPSDDGRLLAYGLSAAGSDWKEWRVLNVATGEQLADHIQWVKFSDVAWTKDGKGFFYSRYDEPRPGDELTGQNFYQKLYYHSLGDPQANDTLVYERPDEKEWGFGGQVTEDGRYLVITVWRGTERKNQVFYKDLQSEAGAVVELLTGFDSRYEFISNDGAVFQFVTDLDAPMKRVVEIDIRMPHRKNWYQVIPESRDLLESVSVVGRRMFATYLHDAYSVVKSFDLDGLRLRELPLPSIGSAGGFQGRRADHETFYWFTSFTAPPAIYRLDCKSGESAVFRQPDVAFDPADFETKQVFYTSRDGTRVPMFIVHKTGLPLDGNNPTLLYGYGGFDAAVTPQFRVMMIAWMENGGVFASANLRGGSEYGRAWHEAGMRNKKQNVFDDFVSAAEWLIENKYTSRRKLAIHGRSNGGLLVGAAMTQRPDLFAAVVPTVGVMDMLRYHKFTIGWAWANEYGSSDKAEEFEWLRKYSPLHNLKTGTRYPATLITTGDHDDRVVPAHSYKFAAALQAAQAKDGPPALIRIDTSAGHGVGKPTKKLIDESADILAFLAAVLDLQVN